MATRTQRTRLSTVTATLSGTGNRVRVYWTGTPAPASVSSTQTYSLSFSSLLGGSLAASATITSVGTALPTGWSLNSAARTLNYDGTGSATTVTGIVLRATASGETADSGSFGVTVVSSGTSPGSGTVTTFQLTTTAVPGTYPFTIGHGFAKGDVPVTAITDLSNYQIAITRTWNDGSAKHVVISGRVTFTSGDVAAGGGYAKTVTISRGTPPTGTALTSANIAAISSLQAGNINRVTCGAFGFVDLSTLLASPVRTIRSGPEMVECLYQAEIGSTEMLVLFQVRLFADGRVWIRATVENGYAENMTGANGSDVFARARVYTPSVVLGGTAVVSAAFPFGTHYGRTRYMGERWVVGSDPLIVPRHNVPYLLSTKLVPMLSTSFGAPSAATLNALTQTYTPFAMGDLSNNTAGAGAHPAIGLLTQWDSLYCTTADPRAYRAVIANSAHNNSYLLCTRSKATKLTPRIADFPTWGSDGPLTGGEYYRGINGNREWDALHHPSEGYLAYLITGDVFHLETLGFIVFTLFAWRGQGNGNGYTRIPEAMARELAWACRSIAQYSAIGPKDGSAYEAVTNDYQAWLQSIFTTLRARKNQPNWNPFGLIANSMLGGNEAYGTGLVAGFLYDYVCQAFGYLSDMDAVADTSAADVVDVRNYTYKWATGRFGRSGVPAEYGFVQASQYTLKVSDVSAGPTSPFYSNFGQVWTATFGSANSVASNTLLGSSAGVPSSAPQGYWGYAIAALAYAAEHDAPDADAGLARLVGATNWTTVRDSGFNNIPNFGILPRNYALPAWRNNQAVNEWRQISGTALSTVPATGGGNNAPQGKSEAWCGWHIDPRTSDVYTVAQGGHNDYYGNEVNRIRLTADAPAWTELRPRFTGTITATSQFYTTGEPASRHGYYTQIFSETLNKALLFPGGAMASSGNSIGNIHAFNISNNTYDPLGTWSGLSTPFDSSAIARHAYAKHPTTEAVYVWAYNNGLFRWNVGTPGSWSLLSSVPIAPNYTAAAIDPTRGTNSAGQILFLGGGLEVRNIVRVFDIGNPGAGLQTITLSGTDISGNDGMALVYVQALNGGNGAYVACARSAGGSAVYQITPSSGTSWACSAISTGTSGNSIPSTVDANGAWVPLTRFLYVPALGGCIYGPRFASNLWFLRLH